MSSRIAFAVVPMILAVYMPTCAPKPQPTVPPWQAHMSEFWRLPTDLAQRDFFFGPWGPERAPDPAAIYTFVERKRHGTNPGMTIKDAAGREWHVKQPTTTGQGAEGPIEVVLSRVLSGLGYHQPPVYFLPSFTVADASGTHQEVGGRFRLHLKSMKKVGDWSWQQNPFAGTKPYQGLLVVLMLFDGSDLKNENNTLYEVRDSDGMTERWYVVRDLGTALGETARLFPKRGDPDIFERQAFIKGVKDGFVEFNYHGWHQELVRNEITPDDLAWAAEWLAGISRQQWADAFRAGGYETAVADRFIATLIRRIAEAENVALTTSRVTVFDSLLHRPGGEIHRYQ